MINQVKIMILKDLKPLSRACHRFYVLVPVVGLVSNIDFAQNLKRFEIAILPCFSSTHSSFKIPFTAYGWINTWLLLVPDLRQSMERYGSLCEVFRISKK